MLGYRHAPSVHYTMGGARWQGIADTRYSRQGQFPNQADCSAYATWCLWNALWVPYKVKDVVNGAAWKAGYTGTMLNNGQVIKGTAAMRRGDLVIYGNGFPGKHVAIMVGRRGGPKGVPMVVSHGSEGGPYYVVWNYRSDIMSVRRYI
jgi:cell wall-associated NlpC family hydrolase